MPCQRSSKTRSLKDEQILPGTNKYGDPNIDGSLTENLPEVHKVMRDLRDVTDSFPGNRVLIGETYLPNVHELEKWYGANHDELQMPMDMQVGFINKLDANQFRDRINEVEHDIGDNQPLLVFDNHDNPRMDMRYGDGMHDVDIQRMLATVLFATRSTALMYYGDELGMKTTPPTRVEDVKDPVGRTGWPKEKGRDGERTPMQWDGSPEAGFTTGEKPWLPVPDTYKTVNVEEEVRDDDSLLNWYKQLIRLRRENPALHLRHADDAEHDGFEGAVVDAAGSGSTGGGGGLQLYRGAAEVCLRPVTAWHHEQAGEDADEDARLERSGITRCSQPAAVRRVYRAAAVAWVSERRRCSLRRAHPRSARRRSQIRRPRRRTEHIAGRARA